MTWKKLLTVTIPFILLWACQENSRPKTTLPSTSTSLFTPTTSTSSSLPGLEPEPTVTSTPPTMSVSTTIEIIERASTPRSTVTTAPYVSPRRAEVASSTQSVRSGDFWYRLATCESENGRTSDNQFQFMGGTAEKVGYYPGASYSEQVAMAQDWAARIHPNEGTTAGWPVCWWVALG